MVANSLNHNNKRLIKNQRDESLSIIKQNDWTSYWELVKYEQMHFLKREKFPLNNKKIKFNIPFLLYYLGQGRKQGDEHCFF